MSFDLAKLTQRRHGENFELHAKYMNPMLTKVITTLGFDRFYERAKCPFRYEGTRLGAVDRQSGQAVPGL
jgi:ornithine--oxo-acid transaminase